MLVDRSWNYPTFHRQMKLRLGDIRKYFPKSQSINVRGGSRRSTQLLSTYLALTASERAAGSCRREMVLDEKTSVPFLQGMLHWPSRQHVPGKGWGSRNLSMTKIYLEKEGFLIGYFDSSKSCSCAPCATVKQKLIQAEAQVVILSPVCCGILASI